MSWRKWLNSEEDGTEPCGIGLNLVVLRVGKVGNYPGEKHWVITGEKGHRVNTPSEEKRRKT